MTTSSRKLTAATAASALIAQMLMSTSFSGDAQAADMLADEVVEYTNVEFGTGWYIRGDISLSAVGDLFDSDTSTPIPGTQTQQITRNDSETLVGGGVAVGYRLNSNLRLDLGLESLGQSDQTSFATTTNFRPPCSDAFVRRVQNDPANPLGGTIIVVQGGHTINNCIEESSSSYSLVQFGPTAYYDFDTTFLGARPFVGGGLGVVRNTYSFETGTITCTAAAEERCNPTDGGVTDFGEAYTQVGTRDNGTSYHLSASLAAGLAFKVSDNFFLDASYQYSRVFETPIFGGNSGISNSGVPTDMHSLKLGLRYEIW